MYFAQIVAKKRSIWTAEKGLHEKERVPVTFNYLKKEKMMKERSTSDHRLVAEAIKEKQKGQKALMYGKPNVTKVY